MDKWDELKESIKISKRWHESQGRRNRGTELAKEHFNRASELTEVQEVMEALDREER